MQGFISKILSVILIAAILGAIGTLIYAIAMPSALEKFTEFYILGAGGKGVGYPTELVVGEKARVMVGIVNHEQKETSYRVEVTIDGIRNNEVGPVLLGHGEKWMEEVPFTMVREGEKQKVEFVLYIGDKPSTRLHLWVDGVR